MSSRLTPEPTRESLERRQARLAEEIARPVPSATWTRALSRKPEADDGGLHRLAALYKKKSVHLEQRRARAVEESITLERLQLVQLVREAVAGQRWADAGQLVRRAFAEGVGWPGLLDVLAEAEPLERMREEYSLSYSHSIELDCAASFALLPGGGRLAVAESSSGLRLYTLDRDTAVQVQNVKAPAGLFAGPAGQWWACDFGAGSLLRFAAEGEDLPQHISLAGLIPEGASCRNPYFGCVLGQDIYVVLRDEKHLLRQAALLTGTDGSWSMRFVTSPMPDLQNLFVKNGAAYAVKGHPASLLRLGRRPEDCQTLPLGVSGFLRAVQPTLDSLFFTLERGGSVFLGMAQADLGLHALWRLDNLFEGARFRPWSFVPSPETGRMYLPDPDRPLLHAFGFKGF